MFDELDSYTETTTAVNPVWQAVSIAAAMPYLKALGLVTTLIGMWAGLCAI